MVRLGGAGICASELPVWEGREWFEYPRPPGEPGHEGWGVVEALGTGVTSVEPGVPVALISHRAHAEFDVCRAGDLVPLPSGDAPLPGEPLACAVNALGRAGVERGHRVAIVGCGFLGLVLVQLCASICDEVVAVSRRSSALETARATGATAAWYPDDAGLAGDNRPVERFIGLHLVDYVEVLGVHEAPEQGAALLRLRLVEDHGVDVADVRINRVAEHEQLDDRDEEREEQRHRIAENVQEFLARYRCQTLSRNW